MQVERIRSYKLFYISILAIILLCFWVNSTNHIVNYSDTVGIGRTYFGTPKAYVAVLFDFVFWTLFLISLVGLYLNKLAGWYSTQIFLLFSIVALTLDQGVSISTYVGYADPLKIGLLFVSLCSFIGLLRFKENYVNEEVSLIKLLLRIGFGAIVIAALWYLSYDS